MRASVSCQLLVLSAAELISCPTGNGKVHPRTGHEIPEGAV
jgi:hypothetical protein